MRTLESIKEEIAALGEVDLFGTAKEVSHLPEIQFLVNKDDGSFELYAFEIDGVPQSDYMIAGLIEAMFE